MNGPESLQQNLVSHPTISSAHYATHIEGSGIAADVAHERGYCSLTSAEALTRLPKLGFSAHVARLGSGLLLPLTLPDDPVPLSQFRPDRPRQDKEGGIIKYEIPHKRPQRLILHPRVLAALRTGTTPLYITEGAKKVDSLISRGAVALGGIGVWSFTVKRSVLEKTRGTPKVLLPDWQGIALQGRPVIICFDSDAALNTDVDQAEAELGALLRAQGAQVSRVRLPAAPDGSKQGIDDFFAHGHTLADVEARIEPLPRPRFDIISAQDLARKHLPPVRYVIPGKLPAGATLFIGRGKDGKSLMAWNIALATATGGKALGLYEVEQGDVLYLAMEDGERRGQQRLFAQMDHLGMQEPPPRLDLHFWSAPRIGEGFMECLDTWVDEHPEGRLIIVDILEKIRPARTNHGMYTDDYHALETLQQFGQRHNIGVLIVHHSNKTTPTDFRDTANGSMGLTGGCDTFWSLHRLADASDATLKMLGREVEQQAIALQFQDGFWTAQGDPTLAHMRTERLALHAVLSASQTPMTPLQIATALDKNLNTVKTLLRKMLLQGVISQPSYGHYALSSFSPSLSVNSVNSINSINSVNSVNSVSNPQKTQEVSEIQPVADPPPGPEEEFTGAGQEFTLAPRVYGEGVGVNSFQPLEINGAYGHKKQEFTEFTPTLRSDAVAVATLAPPDCLPAPRPQPATTQARTPRYCVHTFERGAQSVRCVKCGVVFPEKSHPEQGA